MKILTLLLTCLLALPVFSQEVKYSGHWRPLEETARLADRVCFAEFENIGNYDIGPPLCSYYSDAVLKISRKLLPEQTRTIGCNYVVQTHPPESRQEIPVLGKAYLILGTFSGGEFCINKMVEPTPENIARVEKVLSSRGVDFTAPPQARTAPPPVEQAAVATPEPREAKPAPTPASEASPLSGHWGLIAVLILAAIGLLWFPHKRRSRMRKA